MSSTQLPPWPFPAGPITSCSDSFLSDAIKTILTQALMAKPLLLLQLTLLLWTTVVCSLWTASYSWEPAHHSLLCQRLHSPEHSFLRSCTAHPLTPLKPLLKCHHRHDALLNHYPENCRPLTPSLTPCSFLSSQHSSPYAIMYNLFVMFII